MKEKIRKLSMGYIDTEFPVVSYDPISINGTVTSGELCKAEIHITSENRLAIRGFVYSSNPNVVLSSDNILGVFIHVTYMIDAERLSEGEQINGEFSIVTNAGEFVIPYNFVVIKGRSEGYDIDTANGFYNLYLKNVPAALELFLSPDFKHLSFMQSQGVRVIYDGLLESNDAENSINEFLLALGYNVNSSIGEANTTRTPTRSEADNNKLLLRDETLFDHAKIDFETNDIMGGAALLEMQQAFKDLKAHGASIEALRFHKAEIAYYKKYSRTKLHKVDRLLAYKGLKQCFDRGCRSPYLYLEVCKAFISYPDLIREYDELTLQAINFGSIHGFLSDEIAKKLGIHAEASKKVPLILLNSMKRMYRFYPSKELLAGIVSALVKNESIAPESFKWYQKGITENIQISRLYDYFLESVPDDYEKMLPKEVYLYYSYNPTTSDKGMKTLYTSVITHFDKTSPTYINLEMQIRRYILKELFEGHIDHKLAILYEEFLHIEMVDEKLSEILPDMLLTSEVSVPNGKNNRLIVLYEELEGEQVAQLNSGIVKIPLYTSNYHFLIEDELGKRHYVNNIRVKKYIHGKDELFYACARYAKSIPAFRILEANELIKSESLDRNQLTRLNELASSSGIHSLYKTKIRRAMLTLFDWKNNKDLSEILISCVKDEYMSDSERAALSDVLIEVDESSVAESLIKKIGYEKIPQEKLLELSIDYIKSGSEESDKEILGQCYYLFKSALYSNETLSFLCKNYNGLCSDMANILLLSINEGANTFDMAERLIAQMLFTNQYKDIDEIFIVYVNAGKADRVIVGAYFALKCYQYFINGISIDPQIFESIKNVLINQLVSGAAPIIMQLAITKYFSSMDEISENDKILCKQIVDNLVSKDMVFPYLKKLSSFINLPEEVKDKTIVTTNAKEGDSVALILIPEDDDEDMIYLEMNYICCGIFVKPVLLFEGEYQSYQIRVTRYGTSTIVEQGELTSDIAYDDNERKYIRLNKLLIDSSNPSDEKWQEDMAEYSFDKALNKLLFTN